MGHHPSPPRRLALGDGAAGWVGSAVASRTPVPGDGPVLRIVMGCSAELTREVGILHEKNAPPRDSFIWRGDAALPPAAGQQSFARRAIRCRYSGQTKAGITCLRMKMTIPGCGGVTRPER